MVVYCTVTVIVPANLFASRTLTVVVPALTPLIVTLASFTVAVAIFVSVTLTVYGALPDLMFISASLPMPTLTFALSKVV